MSQTARDKRASEDGLKEPKTTRLTAPTVARAPKAALADGGANLRGEDKARLVRRMFNQIVPRYDLMNRLMTGGVDRHWRRVTARAAKPVGMRVLDVATGTGDLAIDLRRAGAATVVGADFADQMLAAAQPKVGQGVPLVLADAQRLPFATGSFDRVTNAFLLRNLSDLDRGLAEMRRVLRPGGSLLCLEITRPSPGPFAALFSLYFSRIVPLLGGVLTGEWQAYRYLPNSLSAFPRAPELTKRLFAAGFATVSYRTFGLGTVALHVAKAP